MLFFTQYICFGWLNTRTGFQMCLGNTLLFAADELPPAPRHSFIKTVERIHCYNSQICDRREVWYRTGSLASCIYACGDSIQLIICFSTVLHSDLLLISSTSRLNLVFYYLVEMSLCGVFSSEGPVVFTKKLHQFVLGTLL